VFILGHVIFKQTFIKKKSAEEASETFLNEHDANFDKMFFIFIVVFSFIISATADGAFLRISKFFKILNARFMEDM
jgi:hypothetical protein